MSYAEIVVNSPASRGNSGYHYHIPSDLKVDIGHLLWVPFGPRQMQGVVVELLEDSDVENIKDILGPVDARPVLSHAQVALARWIAEYYRSPLVDAVRLMLPSAIQQKCLATIDVRRDTRVPADLTEKQLALVSFLLKAGRKRVDKAKAAVPMPSFTTVVAQLVRRGIIVRGWELEKPRVRPRIERSVRLKNGWEDTAALLGAVGRAPRQRMVLEYLLGHGAQPVKERGGEDDPGVAPGVSIEELHTATSGTMQTLNALLARGLIEIDEREVWRDPLANQSFSARSHVGLTHDQQGVWASVEHELSTPGHKTFLLHGVTGSGKTEIYLRALEETLRKGQQGIILVPEIALTPQTVHRFASHFPGRVGVWHSRLTPGERYDEWRRIRDGALDIVIGSRSAVFAPLWRPGVIIVDEEHEWSYKHEKTPRYHARDVAIKLGELAGAKVILGSATPDVVTYHRARAGKYTLLVLTGRVESPDTPVTDGESSTKAAGGAVVAEMALMPPVHVVDMRQELRGGNWSIFSRALGEAIGLALSMREQVILFLNRRGAATFVMCRDCGHVLRCRRCDVPLVYHSADDDLVCHQCNYRSFTPSGCPHCWSSRIKFFGVGTQKVEEETKKRFPEARVLRWDSDAASGRTAHEQILQRFRNHEADILIGTQMIAKGLDLPLVTLVGVISADTILHLPDFRAGERTFQLLTQVAGRAGRGRLGGRVIVQTYSPEHYGVQTASRHDYFRFYQQEVAFRREHGYPPFSQLAKLVYQHTNDSRGQQEAERISVALRQNVDRLGLPEMAVLGPAPCYARRIRGRYRWRIIIRGDHAHELLKETPFPLGWIVDVDPLTTL
ncbi:MAG: primosomal protein N' [Chloroflexi bacterium]|nr:primosomal protein N' [Chloroflexota bacterium]